MSKLQAYIKVVHTKTKTWELSELDIERLILKDLGLTKAQISFSVSQGGGYFSGALVEVVETSSEVVPNENYC